MEFHRNFDPMTHLLGAMSLNLRHELFEAFGPSQCCRAGAHRHLFQLRLLPRSPFNTFSEAWQATVAMFFMSWSPQGRRNTCFFTSTALGDLS